MIPLERVHLTHETVRLDCKFFRDCVFTDCNLVYSGEDFGWENTQFVRCSVAFEAHALRTLQFLEKFGFVKKENLNQPQGSPANSTETVN